MARGTLAVMALLGGAAGLRLQEVPDSGSSCPCKSWRQVYNESGVRCGQANEFFFATGRHNLSADEVSLISKLYGKEFCTEFFEKRDDMACTNVNMGEDRGQWCYVDANCSDLSGGAAVNGQVSWKLCNQSGDATLRWYDPESLHFFADDQGVNMGLLSKMSYPVSRHRWEDVSSFWQPNLEGLADPGELLAPDLTLEAARDLLRPKWGKKNRVLDEATMAELKRIEVSNVPTTFDTSPDHHPPHVIVQNRAVYVVMPLKNIVLCVSGCLS